MRPAGRSQDELVPVVDEDEGIRRVRRREEDDAHGGEDADGNAGGSGDGGDDDWPRRWE